MKQLLWKLLGFLSLGMAYIGVITPGIPYSIFVVFAAYCFGNGSPAMHKWLYSHKIFGPFLTNWTHYRVFPTKMKWLMLVTMSVSLITMWFTLGNLKAIAYTGGFMALVAIWAWRYPGSVEEWERRLLTKQGKDNG